MRRTLMMLLALSSMAGATSAGAQDASGGLVYAGDDAVKALEAKVAAAQKPGQNVASGPMLALTPYAINLERRLGAGVSAIHETDAEFFHVIEGSGVLVTGGVMVDAKRTGPHDITGTAIEGGVSRKVAAGDFFVIPEGTPHWFNAVDGKLVLMSVHLPRASSAAPAPKP